MAVLQHRDQKQMGRRRCVEAWEDAADWLYQAWLAQPASLDSAGPPAQGGTSHSELGPLHQLLAKKILDTLTYGPVLGKNFLDDSSLC